MKFKRIFRALPILSFLVASVFAIHPAISMDDKETNNEGWSLSKILSQCADLMDYLQGIDLDVMSAEQQYETHANPS